MLKLKTPYYIVHEELLRNNLEILKKVKDKTNCKILLATKAFSMYKTFPLIGKYLDGTTSSSLFEAKLSYTKMKKQTHIFSPAYKEEEFNKVLKYCDHIVFNSYSQYELYKDRLKGKEIGLRINPELSLQDNPIYDPCSENSRLGIKHKDFNFSLKGIDGLHFHTLCEQNSDALIKTFKVVEEKFSSYFPNLKWINFGGGHHITRNDYDIDSLIELINYVKNKYNLEVYLEPGEAIALNSGFLVSKILDFQNGNYSKNNTNKKEVVNCILDTSFACHMPDVLEMPYRPRIINSNQEYKYKYNFGSISCLAGDFITNYGFNEILNIGEEIVFEDMAIYTMVKNNTFNGINLPSIYYKKTNNKIVELNRFNYKDFKSRL